MCNKHEIWSQGKDLALALHPPTSPVPLGKLSFTSWVLMMLTGNINVDFKDLWRSNNIIYVDFINIIKY